MCDINWNLKKLYLREATIEDMMLLFCWVNDPVVRKSAFHAEEITFAEHRRWFECVLQDECVKIYVLQRGELPVGQVRIESDGTEWKIDYSIDAAWRGNGYGRQLLMLLEAEISYGACLLGEVKSENISSQKVFEGLGYEKCMNNLKGIYEYRKRVMNTGGKTCFLARWIIMSAHLPYRVGLLMGEAA